MKQPLNGQKGFVTNMEIKVRYFDPNKQTLQPQSKGDWIDIALPDDVDLKAGEYMEIPLGFAMELPVGYEALVIPRSSTFKRYGIIQANSVGLIDNDYCGDDDEWHFPAYALKDVHIGAGTRIAQFRIERKMDYVNLRSVEHLNNANRGGFGSTGV